MQTPIQHRYSLDTSSRKFSCPECGQKRAVRYKDNETGEYLPDHVAKCDRLTSCGYHYSPKHYFTENGIKPRKHQFIDNKLPEPPKPVDYIPLDFLSRSVHYKYYKNNNLFLFLKSLFGEAVALNLCKKYLLGTSSHWRGAAIFWQIDFQGNARQCKIMLHNPHTGKRIKVGEEVYRYDRTSNTYLKEKTEVACSKIYGKYLDHSTRNLNLEQCFFGEHLLTEYPDLEVCIVESEKTALIASVYAKDFIWLATGGASGCKWRDYSTYKVLKDRTVTFFPDHGLFNVKSGKTCYQEWCERIGRIKDVLSCKIRVSDILEKRLSNQLRQDQDLADLLINRDKLTGHALTENGYPVAWDYNF